MCRWPLLLLWGLLPGAAAAAAAGGSGRALPHRTLLDSEGKYWLSWGPRGGGLAFRLEVRTAGYVGFGFSPTGAMASADIVVGGVAHGRPYLQVSASPPSPVPSRPRGRREYRRPGGHPVSPAAEAGRHRPPAAPARHALPWTVSSRTPGAKGACGWAPSFRRLAPSFRPGKLSTGDLGQLVSEHSPVPSTLLNRSPACTPATHPYSPLMGKENDPLGL